MVERVLYYALWPLIWMYAPLRLRVSMLLVDDDRVLVVKSNFGPNTWQTPGGGVKIGEQVVEAGIREVQEELGIELALKDCTRLHDSFLVTRNHGILQREVFVACSIPQTTAVKMNHEINDYRWIHQEELGLPKSVIERLHAIA